MSVCSIGVCLLLSAGLGRRTEAQDSVAPDSAGASTASVGEFTLAGTVVNSITGEPLRRVAVEITGASGGMTLTDEAGHFLFEGLGGGRVLVTLLKPGFYESETPGESGVEVGSDSHPVVLKMTPQGEIAGKVTTRDGQPLEGFHIGLVTKENVGGKAMWVERQNQSVTNEDGEFRLPGLEAGYYYISVDQSERTTLGRRGIPNAREQAYARVFYPGVSEVRAATPVEVNPGREAEANFALTPEPMYQVAGVVGGQISGLSFSRKAGTEEDYKQVVSSADGRFQVRLPAGSYVVTGSTEEGLELSTAGASVVITTDNSDLHLPLAPKTNIPVHILTEHAGADNERTLAPAVAMPPLRMQLIARSGLFGTSRWWTTESGGIDDVAAGTYTLDVHGAGEWWVKSAQSGGVDLLNQELAVTDGGQPPPIEITLRDDAGAVTGTVAGVEHWSTVAVLLVQARGKKNYVDTTRMIRGSFRFGGVAPGDYMVVAIDHGEQLEYDNPEVLNPYLSNAQPVHVPPRGTATITLNLTTVGR